MTIILATDHAGFAMKEHLKRFLEKGGHTFEDVGAHALDPDDDYPMYMQAAAEMLLKTPNSVGIVFGGSGQGEAMVLNRYQGIRAIVYAASNPDLVKTGREHNDANVLSVGARFLSPMQVEVAVEVFLSTIFSAEERHQRRIEQIDAS
ncbi:MAG: RpiB/LacA/LacB family sugar-phosphate isomerase [Candidatus Kaiserbacteria bacterium]|nr:RpiB/LacA/LacB family sugar-phosphate isomerase [Candidatus Kaiserbacteria bacterium]